MAVFVSVITYFGAEAIGAYIVNALAIEGLSAVAVSAIGAGTISATATAIRGGSVEDIFKSAVLGGVTSYVGGSIGKEISSVVRADAIMNGNLSFDAANTIGKIAGSAVTGGISSATRAIAAGKDPIETLIKGGLTAGLSAGVGEGVNYATSQIPGFDNLAKDYGGVGEAAQRAIKTGLTSGILGKDVGDAVLNSVVGSISRVGGDYVKDLSSDLRTAYNNATSTGSSLDENYLQQKQIVEDYKSTAAEVEAKRQEIQDNLDKYNKAKDAYDNYQGLRDEDTGNYYKNVYGGIVNVPGSYNEDGTYNPPTSYKAADNEISGRVAFTEPNEFLAEANKHAKLVNETFPDFEKQRAEAEAKVTGLSTKLDELKTAADPLEKTLTDQKAALETNVKNYLTQEEINAQNVAKAVADAATAKERIEAATGTTLTQEQLDAIVKTGDVKTAADDSIKTNTPTNVVTPVNTTTIETPPTTVNQPTGAAAISIQEIMDYVATHSDEEIKAAMERTGVSQAQVDAAKAYITTGEAPPTVTAPVTSTVTTDNSATATSTGPSAEVIKNFVDTHTPEEVQAAMVTYGVTQAQIDAATKPVTQTAQVDASPVVQPPVVQPPVVDTVVAPPPVVAPPVDEPPPVVEPVVQPPVVTPVVVPPVVAPPVLPPVVNPPPIAPVVQPPVVSPPVLPPVIETPVVEQPVTAPLVVPPAETAADLEKVFPAVVEKPVTTIGGLNTLTGVAENLVVPPTAITNPATETPDGLNAVSRNLVDTGFGLQMPDFSKTLGSMATKFLQSKLTTAKKPTTASKPSSKPRLASTPVGGLSAVKAPVKAAAAPRVDVSKLIPVQKAVSLPKTLPSNAKLTPLRNIANLTSLVKKVG